MLRRRRVRPHFQSLSIPRELGRKSGQAEREEGQDVEIEDPPNKGMDIIKTVRVRRHRTNHS